MVTYNFITVYSYTFQTDYVFSYVYDQIIQLTYKHSHPSTVFTLLRDSNNVGNTNS